MIVRALRAEGFMRYELLELTELPSGVIALVGENEAGKSTIGEAIAFSLFGRTIRTDESLSWSCSQSPSGERWPPFLGITRKS